MKCSILIPLRYCAVHCFLDLRYCILLHSPCAILHNVFGISCVVYTEHKRRLSHKV